MKNLIKTIGETVRKRLNKAGLTPHEGLVRETILKGFTEKGRAPSIKEIHERLNLSQDVVKNAIEGLARNDIIGRDRNGEIEYAYPFSSKPTLHRVVLKDGTRVFALCATDAFGISFMLKEDITILSCCPHCSGDITIILKDSAIASKRPNEVIEWISTKRGGDGRTAKACCPFMNLFCSESCLEEFKDNDPRYRVGELYTIEEVIEHGRWIFEDILL